MRSFLHSFPCFGSVTHYTPVSIRIEYLSLDPKGKRSPLFCSFSILCHSFLWLGTYIRYYLILSYPILFYPILSYPIIKYVSIYIYIYVVVVSNNVSSDKARSNTKPHSIVPVAAPQRRKNNNDNHPSKLSDVGSPVYL